MINQLYTSIFTHFPWLSHWNSWSLAETENITKTKTKTNTNTNTKNRDRKKKKRERRKRKWRRRRRGRRRKEPKYHRQKFKNYFKISNSNIRSEHILVDTDGEVKLCGHGNSSWLIRDGVRHSAAFDFKGDPEWMAPEILAQVIFCPFFLSFFLSFFDVLFFFFLFISLFLKKKKKKPFFLFVLKNDSSLFVHSFFYFSPSLSFSLIYLWRKNYHSEHLNF